MFHSSTFLDHKVQRVVQHYWKVAGVRVRQLVIPLGLTFVAAGFEGASYSLLIPLTQALSENSFEFLESSVVFGWIIKLLPPSALASPLKDGYIALLILTLAIAARSGKLLAQYFQAIYVNHRDELYFTRVQESTFSRTLSFGLQFFNRRSLGQLSTELSWSRSVVTLLTITERFVRDLVSMLAKGVVMVALSVPLFVTVAIVFPVVLKIMERLSVQIEKLSRQGAKVEIRTRSEVLDLLATVPLVKALSQERQATEAYRGILDEAQEVSVRRRNIMALRLPVEELLILFSVLAVQGVLIALSDSFVPGDLARLAIFLLIVQQMMPNLKCFAAFSMAMAELRPRLFTLSELLNENEKFIVASGDRSFDRIEKGLTVRKLSFAYADGLQVLKQVSADVPAGALTGVVGESGSGKTTMAELIARFYDCPPGTIFIDGVDIREFSVESLYQRMAFVSQDPWILSRTLRENLTYGLDHPPSDESLEELLLELGLGHFLSEHESPLDILVGDRGVQLSGGQRQRVALARALLRKPELLILDEATSALDSVMEGRVTEAIQRRLGGRTMLVIAHRLSTISDAEHILVFRNGVMVEQGGWDELLGKRGEFHRLVEAQFGQETA